MFTTVPGGWACEGHPPTSVITAVMSTCWTWQWRGRTVACANGWDFSRVCVPVHHGWVGAKDRRVVSADCCSFHVYSRKGFAKNRRVGSVDTVLSVSFTQRASARITRT